MVSTQVKKKAFPGAEIAAPLVSKQASSASLRSKPLATHSTATTGSTSSARDSSLRAAREPQNDHSTDESPFHISLWLLPSPRDKAASHLFQMISSFSEHPGASARFDPHVTLVGGTKCPSRKFLQETLVPRLREGIQASSSTVSTINGSIPCQFEHEPIFKDKWNQACVLVMEESLAFSQLVQLCRSILAAAQADYANRQGDTTRDDPVLVLPRDHYPPPLAKPHMSLYYGPTEGCPSREEVKRNLYHEFNIHSKKTDRANNDKSLMTATSAPPHYSFQASRVAVWKTDPASIEGVAQWEELAVIDLPQI